MSVKLLSEHHLEFLSLKGCCTGSSESTLVKIPHCWKLRVTAQMCSYYRVVISVIFSISCGAAGWSVIVAFPGHTHLSFGIVRNRNIVSLYAFLIGPRHDKNILRGFRQSEIQTSLLSYRD